MWRFDSIVAGHGSGGVSGAADASVDITPIHDCPNFAPPPAPSVKVFARKYANCHRPEAAALGCLRAGKRSCAALGCLLGCVLGCADGLVRALGLPIPWDLKDSSHLQSSSPLSDAGAATALQLVSDRPTRA